MITHHLFSRGEEEEEENRRIWFCIPYTNAWGYIFFDCLIVFFVFNFYVLKIIKKKKKNYKKKKKKKKRMEISFDDGPEIRFGPRNIRGR